MELFKEYTDLVDLFENNNSDILDIIGNQFETDSNGKL